MEWGQRDGERNRYMDRERDRGRKRIKKTWRRLEDESTTMNSNTGGNSQVRRGGMDKERAEEEE